MEIRMFKAKIKLLNITADDIREKFIADGWGGISVQEEAENYFNALKALEGNPIYVTPPFFPRDKDWYLAFWPKESEPAVKEFIWFMEQDEMCGVYTGDREGFDKVWASGEYDSDLMIGFSPEHIEIISEIKNNQEVPV